MDQVFDAPDTKTSGQMRYPVISQTSGDVEFCTRPCHGCRHFKELTEASSVSDCAGKSLYKPRKLMRFNYFISIYILEAETSLLSQTSRVSPTTNHAYRSLGSSREREDGEWVHCNFTCPHLDLGSRRVND